MADKGYLHGQLYPWDPSNYSNPGQLHGMQDRENSFKPWTAPAPSPSPSPSPGYGGGYRGVSSVPPANPLTLRQWLFVAGFLLAIPLLVAAVHFGGEAWKGIVERREAAARAAWNDETQREYSIWSPRIGAAVSRIGTQDVERALDALLSDPCEHARIVAAGWALDPMAAASDCSRYSKTFGLTPREFLLEVSHPDMTLPGRRFSVKTYVTVSPFNSVNAQRWAATPDHPETLSMAKAIGASKAALAASKDPHCAAVHFSYSGEYRVERDGRDALIWGMGKTHDLVGCVRNGRFAFVRS